MSHSKDAIRLTNRTALALRRSAKRIEKISLIGAIVLTLILGGYTIYLGISRLWVVPLMLLAITVLDVLIISFSRSYYLMLVSQAICTEASAREMRRTTDEQRRREKALSDLEGIREDLGEKTVQRIASAGMRQMHGEEDEVEPEDDDLAAPVRHAPRTVPAMNIPRPAQTPQATTIVPPASMRAGYKPPVRLEKEEEQEDERDEDADSPRRRRRKPALQVIHGEQAK